MNRGADQSNIVVLGTVVGVKYLLLLPRTPYIHRTIFRCTDRSFTVLTLSLSPSGRTVGNENRWSDTIWIQLVRDGPDDPRVLDGPSKGVEEFPTTFLVQETFRQDHRVRREDKGSGTRWRKR